MKTKISEWSTTPASNTDIDGINIAEGCAPSGINDAIRDLMAQVRSWQSGASGDPFNGPMNGTIGATTAYAGAFTTLTTSSTVTLNGGTANGVTYLNGSKVLTSGSALTFDGTNLTVGTGASTYKLNVYGASSPYLGVSDGTINTFFGAATGGSVAALGTTSNHPVSFYSNSAEQMRLTTTGLGIGTSSPATKLEVTGDIGGTWTVGATRFVGSQYLTGSAYQLGMKTTMDTRETQIFAKAADTGGYVTIATGTTPTERVRVDGSGNLGIGTSSPLGRLDVRSTNGVIGVMNTTVSAPVGTTAQISLLPNSAFTGAWATGPSIKGYLENATNFATAITINPYNASTGQFESARFDSAGNLGLGTSSPVYSIDVQRSGGSAHIGMTAAGSGIAPELYFKRARGTLSSPTIANGSAGIANIYFAGYDGANYLGTTQIQVTQETTATTGILQSRLTVSNQDGSGVMTERLRLDSSGNLLVGTTTNTNSSKLVVNGTISQTVSGTQYQVVDQSDIGTAPNEIPLNQYLGSLAYQNGDAYYNTGMTVGFRNRIINGAMMIDQRNAGALVSNANGFITDRWSIAKYDPTGGAYSGQQVSDAPTGFVNSLKVTVTTSIAQSSDVYWQLFQTIEGNNSADMGFGTATPSVFTVSFWVKSSVAGTYSFAIYNNAQGGTPRSYVTTYTVNTASTWEYKTITITADGSGGAGLWSTTTGYGPAIYFDLGCGTNQQTTANTWASVNARRISGTVRLMATSGATFQVTGVQLEKGNIATSFDVRPYGTELALCQRYYFKYLVNNNYPTVTQAYGSGSVAGPFLSIPVSMRASPTVSYSGTIYPFNASGAAQSAFSIISWLSNLTSVSIGGSSGSSGLTAGNAVLIGMGTNSYVEANAEL